MPRVNRLWEEFQVQWNGKTICGICGDGGVVLLKESRPTRTVPCICPRGQASRLRQKAAWLAMTRGLSAEPACKRLAQQAAKLDPLRSELQLVSQQPQNQKVE